MRAKYLNSLPGKEIRRKARRASALSGQTRIERRVMARELTTLLKSQTIWTQGLGTDSIRLKDFAQLPAVLASADHTEIRNEAAKPAVNVL